MSEKQETLADIVAEMRSGQLSATVECENCGNEQEQRFTFNGLADRIEAAWRRQEQCYLDQIRDAVNMIGHERFVKEHPSVGDSAAMREALEIAKKAICNHARASHTCDSLAWENSTINANCGDILCSHRDLCETKTAIQKALAAPPRNCDKGTAAEQCQRMFRYCIGKGDCAVCTRRKNMSFRGCVLDWAQMPYTEGGEK